MLNVVILIGFALEEGVTETGIKLPLFVICLLVGIVATNVVPRILSGVEWPTRTRAFALISDLSLNVFLAMSLMSMQLWTLGGLGPALVVVLAAQTIAAVAYILLVAFPAMGKNYDRRNLGRVHRHQPRGDSDGHRQHDVGHETAWRLCAGLHHSAAGLSLLHRHRKRRGDWLYGALSGRLINRKVGTARE